MTPKFNNDWFCEIKTLDLVLGSVYDIIHIKEFGYYVEKAQYKDLQEGRIEIEDLRVYTRVVNEESFYKLLDMIRGD